MLTFFVSNRIWGLLCLLLALAIWLATRTFPEMDPGFPDPALFPLVIAAGLAFSGLMLVVFPRQAEELAGYSWRGAAWWQAVLLIALVASIPLWVDIAGMIPATTGLVLGAGLLFRLKIWIAALTAGITGGLVYVIFVLLLNVPL